MGFRWELCGVSLHHFHRPITESPLLCGKGTVLQKLALWLTILVQEKESHVREADFSKLEPLLWSVNERVNDSSIWKHPANNGTAILQFCKENTFKIKSFSGTTSSMLILTKTSQNEFAFISKKNTFLHFASIQHACSLGTWFLHFCYFIPLLSGIIAGQCNMVQSISSDQ